MKEKNWKALLLSIQVTKLTKPTFNSLSKVLVSGILSISLISCAHSQTIDANTSQKNSSSSGTPVAVNTDNKAKQDNHNNLDKTSPAIEKLAPTKDQTLPTPIANNHDRQHKIKHPKVNAAEQPIEALNPNEHNRISGQLKTNAWKFLHSYKAQYEVFSEGDKLGSAQRDLIEEKGIWKHQVSSTLEKWLLTLRSQEYTKFKISNQQLLTTEFYTSTKISFKKNRTISQTFNWDTLLETGRKDENSWKLPLDRAQPVYDRMSHIIQLRADLLAGKSELDYQVSYKGKRKTYIYKRTTQEKIQTGMGEFETIKIDRVSGDDTQFSMWMSPELNYFPVKIAQIEQDKPDVELLLQQLEFTTK